MSTALTRINQAPFTDDELEIIRSTVASKTSPNQFKLFIQVCKYSGLNPFAKQIYAVVRGSDMTIQTGIDGYRILAERSGKYAGQIGPEWCGEDGEWKDVWLSDKPPVASRIGVLRRDFEKPIWGVARYKSYEQSASPLWRKMPEVMLAKCFSEDTEVLTDQGFQKFSEVTGRVLQVTDQGLEPTDAQPFVQDYDGVMVTLDSDDLNFSVTPNHDMVTTEGKIEAKDMYDQARARPKFWIPRLVKTNNPDLPVSSERIRIAAAFLADGSKVSNTSFRIEVSRPRKVEILRATGLYRYEGTRQSAGYTAHTATRDIVSTSDKARFVYDFSLVEWLCSPDKSIKMESILQMSQEQAQCFVASLIEFDGHVNKDTGVPRFYTSREEHVAAFELACVVAGFSVNKAFRRFSDLSNKPNYVLTVSKRDEIPVSRWGRFYKYEKPHTSQREQTSLKLTRNVSGKVWCVTVPSGVIVVRRNGFSMLCGNCAESLALRKAFPAEMSGIYTAEEMAQADGPMTSPSMNVESTVTPAPAPADKATRKRLNDIFDQGKEKELFSDVQGMAEFITDALELEEPLVPEQLVSLTNDELYRVELAVSADRGLNGAA